jgi:hypothetical protein
MQTRVRRKDSGILAIEEYLEKASKIRSAGNDIDVHDLVFKMMILWIWNGGGRYLIFVVWRPVKIERQTIRKFDKPVGEACRHDWTCALCNTRDHLVDKNASD